MAQPQETEETPNNRTLKIMFLSSDTGGGHRASAESLAKQFQILFPGSTYSVNDMVEGEGIPIYSSLVGYYKHLSAHPAQWKILYEVTNSRAFENFADAHLKLTCERLCRKTIKGVNPDVVVSVHPLMTNVPVLSCAKISQETGRHLPIFTVVTDLGSAHCLWFCNGVEKMFIGSEQVRKLAQVRGKVPDEKLVMAGLPIRHDFALQSEQLGDRMSPEGKAYQKQIREELALPFLDRKVLLLMGGGEGVGSLSSIVNSLYTEFVYAGIDAILLVVCGRNEKLKKALDARDWDQVLARYQYSKENGSLVACSPKGGIQVAGCIDNGVTNSLRRILSTGALMNVGSPLITNEGAFHEEEKKESSSADPVVQVSDDDDDEEEEPIVSEEQQTATIPKAASFSGLVEHDPPRGKVKVMSLGFVKKMAEYMVAADVLVSKAGPGTISEAAALSLPVMLTSFLPGQEEGNVDYVVDGGFGAYCSDRDPVGIAEEVVLWLNDEEKLAKLSAAAKARGAPYAARNIAKTIGESALRWKELNDEREQVEQNV